MKPYVAGDLNDLPALGGDEDLELVLHLPLKRANFAFQRAMDHQSTNDEIRQSAQLSLAYIALAAEDYARALELAAAVLTETEKEGVVPSAADGNDNAGGQPTTPSPAIRRQATARMYAAEAACLLGDAMQAMKFLAGAGDGQAFDRLASELSGVPPETAKTSWARRCFPTKEDFAVSDGTPLKDFFGRKTASGPSSIGRQNFCQCCDGDHGKSLHEQAIG